MEFTTWVKAAAFVGAGLSMGLGAIGSGIGEGYAASKASEGMGRQRGVSDELLRTMLVGQAVAESTGIYALVIGLLLVFRDFSAPTFLQIPTLVSAGLCMGLGAMGPAIGEGWVAGYACEAIARNPETSPIVIRTMLVGQAVAESTGIYSLVVALLMIFVI